MPGVQHHGQGRPETLAGKTAGTAAGEPGLFKLSRCWVVKADLDMVLRDTQLFGF